MPTRECWGKVCHFGNRGMRKRSSKSNGRTASEPQNGTSVCWVVHCALETKQTKQSTFPDSVLCLADFTKKSSVGRCGRHAHPRQLWASCGLVVSALSTSFPPAELKRRGHQHDQGYIPSAGLCWCPALSSPSTLTRGSSKWMAVSSWAPVTLVSEPGVSSCSMFFLERQWAAGPASSVELCPVPKRRASLTCPKWVPVQPLILRDAGSPFQRELSRPE